MASSIITLIAVAGKNTLLDKMLESLAKCEKPDSYKCTIIVENGPKYDAKQVVKKYQDILYTQYLHFPKGNKSAALNYALEKIGDPGTLVFFTDDDGYIEEDTLVAYETASIGINSGYFFGGQTKVTYEKDPPAWLIESLPPSARGWSPKGSKEYLATPQFLGINWAAFVGDIKKLNGFNENLGPGTKPKRTGQEWDMQRRMLAANLKPVYVENAIAWHDVPEERCSFSWMMKRRFQNGLGVGIVFVEERGRYTFPLELVKYFVKASLLLLLSPFLLSRGKMALSLGNFIAGVGRIKGYFKAYFSNRY